MNEHMVDWAKNAIQAAQIAKVKYLVRSSGAGADSNSSYLMPHVQGLIDDVIKESGIPYAITKPASFRQNFVNLLANDIKRGEVYLPVGNGKIGPVDVRDIAAVNKQVLISPKEYRGRELTVTGSECLSYEEALQIISKVIGRPISFTDVPSHTAIETMKGYGMSDFNIRMVSSLYEIIRHGYAEMTTDTVKDITGHNPISFQQFVEENASGWK